LGKSCGKAFFRSAVIAVTESCGAYLRADRCFAMAKTLD
jgi:hypothetical protein